MKKLVKLSRNNLRAIQGGIDPKAGCSIPCDVYCAMEPQERPPCRSEYIVAHCNGCKTVYI